MQSLNFLIVEDEAVIALVLQKILTRAGHTVCATAATGAAAVAAARQSNPQVVLMDIRLIGDMDGIEAARQISVFCPAQLIFTTGYSEADVRARALALNPVAYLLKPVDLHQIEAALQSAGLE